MKILVTGGSGLVGNALKKLIIMYEFKYKDYDFIFISSKEADLTNIVETVKLFEKELPDFVIHLASYNGSFLNNIKKNVEIYEKNILINNNVLKCCHDFNVKKVISCLSNSIFPSEISYPINETMLHQGPPFNLNEGYAYSKRMLEMQSRSYQKQYGDNFICFIPCNIYGEYDNFSLEDGGIIPALIHKCYIAKKNAEKFIVCGSGKPLRQFIYSLDLAKMILWCLFNYNEREPIILSVSETDEISIKNIAIEIARQLNYEYMIEFDENFPDGQFKKTLDNSKIMKYSNFNFIKIEDGIKNTVEWFIKNYQNCKK